MANQMKLVAGGTTIEFSPLLSPDYEQPDDRDRKFFEADDGTRYYSDYGKMGKYSPALNNISKTDADQINTWWQNSTMMTFTADLQGAPATTIFVRLLNEQRPIQMWYPGWQAKYTGLLNIHEVSSSSSSA